MSANVVGPIASGNYAHRREEVKRKKMIKSTKVTQKTGLVMVNEFVHGHSPPDKRVQLKRKVVSAAAVAPWRQRGGGGGGSAAAGRRWWTTRQQGGGSSVAEAARRRWWRRQRGGG